MSISTSSSTTSSTSPSSPQTRRPVKILPPHVVNRIAAGEVVERPSAVLKELIENALDAGATRIEVEASLGGRTLRIADDGCGMSPEDATLAFLNHATSKIESVEDLEHIETLGFRGEALASIASVSKMSCFTRPHHAETGSKIVPTVLGEPVVTEAGCAPGTVMLVEELFYNTPVRLKFLKKPKTELAHIEEAMQAFAIAHPEVQFKLVHEGRVLLDTPGTGEAMQALEQVFRLKGDERDHLLPVQFEDPLSGIEVYGYVASPDRLSMVKNSKRWWYTFVNHRVVRCSVMSKAIDSAFQSITAPGTYPMSVLFLKLPADAVDVNVHPTKKEVRYARPNQVFQAIFHAIRKTLETHRPQGLAPVQPWSDGSASAFPPTSAPTPVFHSGGASGTGSGSFSGSSLFSPFSRGNAPITSGDATSYGGGQNTSPTYTGMPTPQQLNAFYQPLSGEAPQYPVLFSGSKTHALFAPTAPNAGPTGEPTLEEREPSLKYRVIGQLYNTYILLETLQGLMVIDQHIASERAGFERLKQAYLAESPLSQQQLTLDWDPLRPEQLDLLDTHRAWFESVGITYALNAEAGTFSLRGFPIVYPERSHTLQHARPQDMMLSLLEKIHDDPATELPVDDLFATMSCHSAVRAGDPLSLAEMAQVTEGWLHSTLPWTCPHGRPIAHTIRNTDLAAFFNRPSLPKNAF